MDPKIYVDVIRAMMDSSSSDEDEINRMTIYGGIEEARVFHASSMDESADQSN